MARTERIATEQPWIRLGVDDADWRAEDAGVLARMLEQVLIIRRFEEKVLELHGAGLIHGPAHASIGQEAGAVGAMIELATTDTINGTHRAHHQILAKLLNTMLPAGYDPRRDALPAEAMVLTRRALAEIMGLKDGFCGGRGGSMHMRWAPAGIPGTSAIIGGNLPHAAGYGLAAKVLGTGSLAVSFFGDGTIMNGAAYEAMNLAALYGLPVIFFVENNYYAVSTALAEQTREIRLTSRGPMLGFPGVETDGMDAVAVRAAMRWAKDHIARHGGPVLVETQTYRFLHQMGPRPGSEFGYRTKDEEQAWRARDPVVVMPRRLIDQGVLDEAGAARLDARARALVDAATSALVTGDANRLVVRPGLAPDPATVDVGIRGDQSELAGQRVLEADAVPANAREDAKYITAVADVLVRNMERDPTIVVMGEDVHRLRGGVSGSTRGVIERFPERIFATPICENGFLGMALGAALQGLRPVVDIMFGDFCLSAADQLFNQIAKVRHMFGGDFPVRVVVRCRVSPSTGYGSQHAGDPSGLFSHYPAWRIVAPTTPHDYVGLMNAALRCDDPVVVIEHVELFQTSGSLPKGDLDFLVPFERARVARPGRACTVLASGVMVGATLAAAEASGIDAEVIDLRSLDPLGLDWSTIAASVAKTNRVLVAEQAAKGIGIGARIAQELQERLFDQLDHEVLRVTGSLASPVVSAPLNRAALADSDKLVVGLRNLVGPWSG
ncbi:MAG: MFS transporter [Alphaproteobacteria bacterium]|nr:MFS transporter [Alphaproteobacteria bacterium]